jgi:hypothetical protein
METDAAYKERRRFQAAYLRTAMALARDGISSAAFPALYRKVGNLPPIHGAGPWERLSNIADNLFTIEPDPPTLDEAKQADNRLTSKLSTMDAVSCSDVSTLRNYIYTLSPKS